MLRKLSPVNQAVFEAIGPAFRSALSRLVTYYTKRGQDVSLDSLLTIWSWQTPKGQLVARCAGLGHPFQPEGLNKPTVMRVKRELGLSHENLCLVTQGYFKLRTAAGVYGREGHEMVLEWMAKSERKPDWDPHRQR